MNGQKTWNVINLEFVLWALIKSSHASFDSRSKSMQNPRRNSLSCCPVTNQLQLKRSCGKHFDGNRPHRNAAPMMDLNAPSRRSHSNVSALAASGVVIDITVHASTFILLNLIPSRVGHGKIIRIYIHEYIYIPPPILPCIDVPGWLIHRLISLNQQPASPSFFVGIW